MKLINTNSVDKVVCYLVSNQAVPIIMLPYNILKIHPKFLACTDQRSRNRRKDFIFGFIRRKLHTSDSGHAHSGLSIQVLSTE